MVKVVKNSRVEDMVFNDNYILIMCKELSSIVIKKLARKQHKVGIYYRNGYVLDTVNGILTKIDKTQNETYELAIYPLQERMLKCVYEKTTPLDKLGGCGLVNAFTQVRQINVNSKIFPRIKFLPDLQETLDSFVDETTIGQFYKD